jgi:hypothetical protein
VPASAITLTVLGDGLGAVPWCERCGDFVPVKPVRKKRAKAPSDDDPIPF